MALRRGGKPIKVMARPQQRVNRMRAMSTKAGQALHIGGRRTEHVYRMLLDGIREGRFEVNRKLPTENELAEEFSVSRPVVRNALALLRQEGLVHSIQGSGSIVIYNPAQPERDEKPVEAIGNSVRDLQRCFEFRALIEAEAAYAAALRYNEASLERLSATIYTHPGALPTPRPEEAWKTFDFHHAVIDAADSVFLQQSFDLVTASAGFRVYLARHGRKKDAFGQLARVNAEHIDIFRLIERRQAVDAREAMRGHVQRAYDTFMEQIPLVEPA